jgi:hypothetical protein
MARITTASLDLRTASLEEKLDGLITVVANLAQLVAPIVAQSEAPQVAPTTSDKAKTPHQIMGEENELHGRMYTARYTCTTEGCTNKTGFYKVESAQAHAERKSHSYKAIEFAS